MAITLSPFTQMLRTCPTGHLIGIKRKPCEVSQSLLRKPSLNSDIQRNVKLETIDGIKVVNKIRMDKL